jgi:hypothetical protein
MTTAPAAEKQKSRHAAERDTERVQTWRAVFRAAVQVLEVRRLPCVEESGTPVAMTRR